MRRQNKYMAVLLGLIIPLLWTGMACAQVALNIGDIPAGRSVSIIFDVTVNNNGPLFTLSNQGSVSGDNFAAVDTDDPDTPAMGDATVTILNRVPVALDDSGATDEDTLLSVFGNGVLANDSDPDADPITIMDFDNISTSGAGIVVNSDGSYTYDPTASDAIQSMAEGETQTDTFGYTISDGLGGIADATVSIMVTGVNDPPTIDDAAFSVDENTPNDTVIGSVESSDRDVSDTLVFGITGGNTGNAFAINEDTGEIKIINWDLLDHESITRYDLTIEISDGLATDEALVTIHINDVNDNPPVINNKYFSIDENSPNGTVVGSMVASDADETATLTYSITGGNTGNAFVLNENTGEIRVHDQNQLDREVVSVYELTIRVSDGLAMDDAVAIIYINDVNDNPPMINDQAFAIDENSPNNTLVDTVVASDADATATLTYSIIGGNTGDAFSINDTNGEIRVNDTSLLDHEVVGQFDLTVRVSDGINADDSNVTILVTNVNETPVGVDDAYEVNEGEELIQGAPGVLGNDEDPENDTLSAILVSDAAHGALTLNPNGSFTYLHDGTETLTDAFTYKAYDGSLEGDTVTVTITINPVNDLPLAVDDIYAADVNGTVTEDAPGILSNDSDAENDSLTAILVSDVTHGTLSLNPDGSFQYMHDGSEAITDTFTYQAHDGTEGGNSASVTIYQRATYYYDEDGDGYGDPNRALVIAIPPTHYVAPRDCDDTDPVIYPEAPELCDCKDNDCNGSVDEGCTLAISTLPPLVVESGGTYAYEAYSNYEDVTWTLSTNESIAVKLNGIDTDSVTAEYCTITWTPAIPGDYGLTLRAVRCPGEGDERFSDEQNWNIHVKAPSILHGSLDYSDNQTGYPLPCGCSGDLQLPVRIDLYSDLNGRLVASTHGNGDPNILSVDTNCTSGEYAIRPQPSDPPLSEGPYTLMVNDQDPFTEFTCYGDANYRGIFDTLAISLYIHEGENVRDILVDRKPLNLYQISGKVRKIPPGPGNMTVIFFGIDDPGVRKRAVLSGQASASYSFSAPAGIYRILAQAGGYAGKSEEIQIDETGVEYSVSLDFDLYKRVGPSVSIIRQNIGSFDDFAMNLFFRYNDPAGIPQGWTDAHADLRINLFAGSDDLDADGVPDAPADDPQGDVVPTGLSNAGVFDVEYYTGLIRLGDLFGNPNHVMTTLEAPGRFIVGIHGEMEIEGDPNIYPFIRTFSVLRPPFDAGDTLLTETHEYIKPSEIFSKKDVPYMFPAASGNREVMVTGRFNAGNIDPSLLYEIDNQGTRLAEIDRDEPLLLNLKYQGRPDAIVVDLALQYPDGRMVAYNPPEPGTGERDPSAQRIVLDIPLHRDLQAIIHDTDITLADIEALIARNPEDFVRENGVWEPKDSLYGVFFRTGSGRTEGFIPEVSMGEGIEVVDSPEGILFSRTMVTHTSAWFSAHPEELDGDLDGYSEIEGDCDDTDPSVYPNAPGTHEGKDNNCDGIININEKKPSPKGPYLYYSFPVFSFQDQGYKPISNKYNLWIIPDYSRILKIPNYSQINRLLSNELSVNDFYPSHYYSNYGSRLNYSHFPQSPKWTPELKKFYEKWGYTGY
ncbi:MAG: Ig-like domain-containing protein [bacterium]